MSAGVALQVEVCEPAIADRMAIKNLFVFYRYELMPFITEGVGSMVNPWGVIGSADEANHEASVDNLDVWRTKPNLTWCRIRG